MLAESTTTTTTEIAGAWALLIVVVLGILTWGLLTISNLKADHAVLTERVSQHVRGTDQSLKELKSWVKKVNTNVVRLLIKNGEVCAAEPDDSDDEDGVDA